MLLGIGWPCAREVGETCPARAGVGLDSVVAWVRTAREEELTCCDRATSGGGCIIRVVADARRVRHHRYVAIQQQNLRV